MATYLILDTNVLVSALWSGLDRGKPARLLQMCVDGQCQAVCTRDIFGEYLEVLARPRFAFLGDDVAGVLDFFRYRALFADPLFDSLARPRCGDRSDQAFYDAACCCDALLVTGNKKDYPADRRVLTPAEFLS